MQSKNGLNVEIKVQVLCESASFSHNQKLNLINIFSSYNSGSFPLSAQPFYWVVSLSVTGKNESGFRLEPRIVNPDGKVIKDSSEKIDMPIELPKELNDYTVNLVLEMKKMVFVVPGKYKFQIVNGTEIISNVNMVINKT